MLQSDSFYEQLPFTLQEQHLKSEVLILGTGLKQSLLAAYLSKMEGKQVLILDQQKTYGSCLKSITLKELYQLSTKEIIQHLYNFHVPEKYKKSNQQFFNQKKQKNSMRGYNIDIQPCFFMGNSLTCQCLKQADMDKYIEFRLINNLLNYEKGKLQEVPLSKGKIFDSKSLSLMQKKKLLTSLHILMRLYQQQMGVEQDHNSTKQFDKGFGVIDQETFNDFKNSRENNFVEFLQKITKKNKKIMDLIAYVICGYQYDYSKTLPEHMKDKYKLRCMIERFGKFISSCGIYGETPYLYVDNGVGDIPQAFSRVASIFGSTFILHPKIVINNIQFKQAVVLPAQKIDEENNKVEIKEKVETTVKSQSYVSVTSNIAPGKQIHPQKIYFGQTFHQVYSKTNSSQFYTQNVLRLLVLAKKIGKQTDCPSLAYFIGLETFSNPVSMFIFDDSTHTCPSGHVLYQFSSILTEGQETQIEKKTDILIQKLKQVRGQQFEASIQFVTGYIRKNMIPKQSLDNKDSSQILFRGYQGLDLQGHFEQLVQIVGKKDNYFRKKNPYQQEFDQSDEQDHNLILQQLDNMQIVQPITPKSVQIPNQQSQNQSKKLNEVHKL